MSVLLKVQGYAAQSKSETSTQMPQGSESFLNNDATIDGLARELPRYLAAADGTVIEEEEEKVQWWARQARTLPNRSAVVRKLLLVQLASASAEHSFSLMDHFFHPSTGECT